MSLHMLNLPSFLILDGFVSKGMQIKAMTMPHMPKPQSAYFLVQSEWKLTTQNGPPPVIHLTSQYHNKMVPWLTNMCVTLSNCFSHIALSLSFSLSPTFSPLIDFSIPPCPSLSYLPYQRQTNERAREEYKREKKKERGREGKPIGESHTHVGRPRYHLIVMSSE